MAQVIKKYIYLSGAKSNYPLHIDYVPNVLNGINEHKNIEGDQM